MVNVDIIAWVDDVANASAAQWVWVADRVFIMMAHDHGRSCDASCFRPACCPGTADSQKPYAAKDCCLYEKPHELQGCALAFARSIVMSAVRSQL